MPIERKVIPLYMTFEQALRNGFAGRMQDAGYTKWVKQLPCCCGCGQPADDPHHPYDVGFSAMGSKVPDYWVIPLARRCHDRLHHSPAQWEGEHGLQLHHTLMTMTQAVYEGRLKT